MSKNLFGISTLIMSIAFLIWSIGETFAYPQGPNVSLGSNPIVTIHCESGSSALSTYPNMDNPYVVPAGYDYIVTDFGAHPSQTKTKLMVNDGNGAKSLFEASSVTGYQAGSITAGTFNTGIKIPSGSVVYCTESAGGGMFSGYLAHQ